MPGKCDTIRTRRNKRIAHFDLNTSIQLRTDPLPGVSRQMIEDVLAGLRKYMNTIEGYYCQSEYSVVFIHKRQRNRIDDNIRKHLGKIFLELARQKRPQIMEDLDIMAFYLTYRLREI